MIFSDKKQAMSITLIACFRYNYQRNMLWTIDHGPWSFLTILLKMML